MLGLRGGQRSRGLLRQRRPALQLLQGLPAAGVSYRLSPSPAESSYWRPDALRRSPPEAPGASVSPSLIPTESAVPSGHDAPPSAV